MSTVNNSVVGKAREAGTNFWLTILAIAILVFAANTALSVWRATRLGSASTAVADLQVLSQQLATMPLSRILDIRGSRESGILADNDQDWHTFATLEIGPHPALSETQAKVIALDYGMKGGKAEIRVRRALLYYALRRLGLDTDPAARKPQDQQIVLLNRDVILGRQGQAEEQ